MSKEMSKIGWWLRVSLGAMVLLNGGQAAALPGQSVTEVASWMQANPTIQPAPGETLLVRRSDSPSRRFTFKASITAPGRATAGDRKDIIRSESISLFDTVDGVNQERMEESLAIIYGEDLYQDYRQASVVFRYPTPEMLNRAEQLNTPLLRYIQGELRQGERYAYWVEVAQTPDQRPQNGQITVLLLEDLPKLAAELQSR
jgi:hypothetical protein